MTEVKDLLDEAVGSYRPRTDQRAVEERVERHRRRRRLAAGSVAVGVFVLAGWFAWTAFRPGGSTVGSVGSGTYVLSDFEVSTHFDRGIGQVDPMKADVSFALHWSSNEYPGVHSCTLQVFEPAGTQIGSVSVEMDSMTQVTSSSMSLPITGSPDGATATGSCDPERLDTPVAYEISDVQVIEGLTVSYVVGWPDDLGDGEYPGTNACTAALFENGKLVAQEHLTLGVPDQQETSTHFDEFDNQLVLVPLSSLDATVACEPYVRESVFPAPKLLHVKTTTEDLRGQELADALGLVPHAWSVGQTLEARSGGVYLDGQIPEGCDSREGDVVIVQQVGDGTFYCARGTDAFRAWMMGQRLIGSTPTPQAIRDQRMNEPRPRIGGWPEDADGDGLISDAGPERIPGLIRAAGDSGVSGYVRYQDLDGPQPADPEQAVELSGKVWMIPLYAEDGATIIDRYTLSEG